MSKRGDVLAALKDVLDELVNSEDVKTVVRVYLSEFDITQYVQADLPLVAIVEPLENTDEECTSQKSMMIMSTKLLTYFLDWAEDPDKTKYEVLVKKIRDKIGNNFTLNGTATKCRVANVLSISGTLPVYNFETNLDIKYYLSEKET